MHELRLLDFLVRCVGNANSDDDVRNLTPSKTSQPTVIHDFWNIDLVSPADFIEFRIPAETLVLTAMTCIPTPLLVQHGDVRHSVSVLWNGAELLAVCILDEVVAFIDLCCDSPLQTTACVRPRFCRRDESS